MQQWTFQQDHKELIHPVFYICDGTDAYAALRAALLIDEHLVIADVHIGFESGNFVVCTFVPDICTELT